MELKRKELALQQRVLALKKLTKNGEGDLPAPVV